MMRFESEEELKEFILSTGCFEERENLRIYEGLFRGSVRVYKRLRCVIDFEDKRVLDVGCGYGRYLIHFPPGSVGVEIQPQLIQFARGLGLEVVSANIEDYIPVENSSFDIIYCNNVLEHMVAPHKLLREFHRILEKNGQALIGIPNMDSSWIFHKVMGHQRGKTGTQLYAYNKKSMQFLLERSGFKVLKTFLIGQRFPKMVNRIIYEKLLPRFYPSFFVLAQKVPDFKYPEKLLEIFCPSWARNIHS